jgi:hypothetical protein
MIILNPGQQGIFEFIFNEDGNFYDPTIGATPSDVVVNVYRGDLGSGAVVDGPYSLLFQGSTPASNYIIKTVDNTVYYGNYGDDPSLNSSTFEATKFSFYYIVPENLFPGNYSVVATSYYGVEVIQYVAQFQVPQKSQEITSIYPSGQKELTTSFVPAFQKMEQYQTNSIVLIGHADGIGINNILRVNSIQEAIDLLKANFNSPLLQGVFDAYAAGCRDIYICAAAPMSEYLDDVIQRISSSTIYAREDATPQIMNFHQRYYDRLEATYEMLKDQDYMDIIVPLEASFIGTGSIDFLTQLASHCQDFHDKSGMIQIGVIGSRTLGIRSSDIFNFQNDTRFTQRYTMFDSQNQIIGDMGRFIIPVYGELIMNHSFLNLSYTATGAATYAGLLSSTAVNESLIRKNLPSVFGLSGVTLTQQEVDRLDDLGINTFTRSSRSRRGNTYQIYVTNDNTLAHPTSNYRKAPQIRLVSMLINEIRALTSDTVGKFAAQKASSDVQKMLQYLKNNGIIADFEMEAYMDARVKGKMYFDISVLSSLGLKKISFNIASGQAA